MNLIGLIFYYLMSRCSGFIIPNEIPTILSVVYSNIPPIKLGIDSRFGYGFRLGPHVDYQTLIEIGPQTNTNPLSTNGTVAKRQSFTFNRIQRLYNEAAKRAKSSSGKNVEKNKKTEKTKVGSIEFKKVPGIDDAWVKPRNLKSVKNNRETLPTKFALL